MPLPRRRDGGRPGGLVPEAAALVRAGGVDVVVADPPADEVLPLLSIVRTADGRLPFVLLMEPGRERVVIDALNGGADRYVEKSGDPADRLRALAGTIDQLVSRERESVSLQSRAEEIEFLSRTAMDFVEMEDDQDIYRYIGERVHGLVPDGYVILLSYDPDTRRLPVRQLVPEELMTRVVREELGHDLVGWGFSLDDELLTVMTTTLGCNRLVEGATSMYYGFYGLLPEGPCNRIDERLDVGRYYSMGFNCRDGLYGVLTLGVRKGGETRPPGADRGLRPAGLGGPPPAPRPDAPADERGAVPGRGREPAGADLPLPARRHRALRERRLGPVLRPRPGGGGRAALRPAGPGGRAGVRSRAYFRSFGPAAPEATIEHRVVLPDGSARWLQWHDRAFFDRTGAVVEFQSVGRDVTERREAEAALEELTAELEDRVQARTAELEAAYRDLEGRTLELRAANRDLESFSPPGLARPPRTPPGNRRVPRHPDGAVRPRALAGRGRLRRAGAGGCHAGSSGSWRGSSRSTGSRESRSSPRSWTWRRSSGP